MHHQARVRFIPARAGNTSSVSASPAMPSVHPRSRGEHVDDPITTEDGAGSSPLARGTQARAGSAHRPGRFIPARAGNTWGRPASPPHAPVHPRSRGEHGDAPRSEAPSDGSSPLARGTRGRPLPDRRPGRFIPARAGNTGAHDGAASPSPVHPRSRGEHRDCSILLGDGGGSSPLARGTLPRRARRRRTPRFIPARAGNTRPPCSRPGAPPVHPRSRGEHPDSGRRRRAPTGSSPLARGTREAPAGPRLERRFIPARAGNTARTSAAPRRPSVHPRSRGEHDNLIDLINSVDGSSPLARGTPVGHALSSRGQRFIPARAGNTGARPAGGPRAPVHPRSRGEHDDAARLPGTLYGSSPLARGTRPRCPQHWRDCRFIPARAGNT